MWGFTVRGSWRPNRTEIFWPLTLMAVNVVSFLFFWCSTGGLRVHSAGWWLSLLHLISIFSGPQLIRAPSPFGLVWLSLPQLVSNSTTCNSTVSSNSTELYNRSTPTRPFRSNVIKQIKQLPSSRNNNRHQVEITVMQFRGHSLPVHLSMSVPWEFFYLVPFHQPISAHAISSHNCH